MFKKIVRDSIEKQMIQTAAMHDDDDDFEPGFATFSNVNRSMERRLPSENSTALSFYSLLYVANEQRLRLDRVVDEANDFKLHKLKTIPSSP